MTAEFNQAIAGRAKVDIDTVVEVFAGHGVHQWVARPPAPRMTIHCVQFAGTNIDGDPYEFKWEPDTGLWAIATVENNVGKSSVLDVIRWLLSGRDRVDDVVREMIDRAMLEVLFVGGGDEVRMEVEVSGPNGSAGGSVTVDDVRVATFAEDSFEEVMNGVMLPRLGLEELVRWQKFSGSEDGRKAVRNWTSLLPAFFLPKADADAPLGSTIFDSGMLVQVYLGLPWYSTYLEIMVARKALQQHERDAERRDQRDAEARSGRTAEVEREVSEMRERLEAIPDTEAAEQRIAAASSRLTEAHQNREKAVAVVAARERDSSEAAELARDAARRTRAAQETLAARGLFGDLRVEICPHCEVAISDERRKAEADEQVCMVCTRSEGTPATDAAEALSYALAQQTEADLAERQAEEAAEQARADAERAAQALSASRAERDRATTAQGLIGRRVGARIELARAEGELRALQRPSIDEGEGEPDLISGRVLDAARKEALARMTDDKSMERLSEAVAQLCRDFGMDAVERIAIDRSASVSVTVGEVTRPFAKLRETEKQRVRIAIVVALIRLARPVRHPGLIVIDSPADGELADENLAAMLDAVTTMCASTERLQVLIATTRTEQIARSVAGDRVLARGEGQRLW